jgi:hypothetical protein
VAPLTLSTLADCDWSTSLFRIGTEYPAIWESRPFWSGTCNTVTLVIVVPENETCTCTSPYLVEIAAPVIVLVAPAAAGAVVAGADAPVVDADGAAAAVRGSVVVVGWDVVEAGCCPAE